MTAHVLPVPAPRQGWRPSSLLLAPHRLGFFLGHCVLAMAALWWGWVQLSRTGVLPPASLAVPPTTLHSVLMVFGFFPLYFSGFLFTAGPRWLAVDGPGARSVAAPLLSQAAGWALWLAGGHQHLAVAVGGLLLAALGLGWTTLRFAWLVRASAAEDRLHAKVVLAALVAGVLCLAALGPAILLEAARMQRALVLTALWGLVVVVYVTVAHRMIPFFTSSALPFVQAWRPFWLLWLMLGICGFEAAGSWADALGWQPAAWLAARALLETAAGVAVIAVAIAWGLAQSLKVRLLGMLHLGFSWLGVALLLAGASHGVQAYTGEPVLPLASLHALSMGCLGSLLLAMVTRVSCGHSGRPLVADNFIWALFWALQAAVVLRVAASLPLPSAQWLLAAAATAWAAVVLPWAIRLGDWYGRTRADGRPG